MSETEKAEKPKKVSKVEDADRIVKSNMLWAVGAGLIPVPFLDTAGIAAVQIKMLNELSVLYGLKFSENKVKNVIGVLAGSVGAQVTARPVARMIKLIPIVGQLSMLAMPAIAGAFTYALGKVFVKHFESGGTFLDFDVEKMKDFFFDQFKTGKKVAEGVQKAAQVAK